MRRLGDWDEDYILNNIMLAEESNMIEKKACQKFSLNNKQKPDGGTKEELAKQVSAFSNSGSGFIVYGITDEKTLDEGVPIAVGDQSTKDWVEAIIPNLVSPSTIGCQAKIIRVANHHKDDKAILVVSVPLSERRPHWVVTNKQEHAYIRAGAHSCPMGRQTFLDLASRTSASEALIESINPVGPARFEGSAILCRIQPRVRLINGPICEKWAFELEIQSGRGKIKFPTNLGAKITSDEHLYLINTDPLFPGRSTPISSMPFTVEFDRELTVGSLEIVASLYAGSSRPIRRVFTCDDIDPNRRSANLMLEPHP